MTAGSSSDRPARPKGRLTRLAGAVTGRVAQTIDPDLVLEYVDVDQLVDRVDVNHLLDRIDPDRLLDRVDVDRLLDRIDVNRVLDRVDVDRLMARVDVDALLDAVDLEAAVRRAGVPEIVAESTERMAGSALDLARRQLAGLDTVVDRVVNRLLGRNANDQPTGPPRLAAGPTP